LLFSLYLLLTVAAYLFASLHTQLYPYIQSLPDVLRHQKSIVNILIVSIDSFSTKYLSSLFSVISVFTRDIQQDIKPHFNVLFKKLIQIADKVAMSGGATADELAPNPELTAILFETLSYLMK
jgi:hypothetical protein